MIAVGSALVGRVPVHSAISVKLSTDMETRKVIGMSSDEHTECLRISGDAKDHVESFIHEIRKNAADGQRYGVSLDVEKIDDPEENDDGFERASER